MSTCSVTAPDGLDLRAGEAGPMELTAARIMAFIRIGQALWLTPTALAASQPPVSWRWLIPVLMVFVVWSAVYARVALTRGLLHWIVYADVAITCGMCLLAGWIVPVDRISDGSGWVATVASLCVVGLPLAWRAWRSIPAGLLVVVSFAAGFRIAGHPELGQQHTFLLIGQLLASAAVMGLVRRHSRAADVEFAATHHARRLASVDHARREDVSAQLRLLHDTAVTTLTLVGAGAIDTASDNLSKRAGADLAAIERIGQSATAAAETLVRMDLLLSGIAAGSEIAPLITSDLAEVTAPALLASAFAGAVDEALRNAKEHANATSVRLSLRMEDGAITVEVSDNGKGFDPAGVPAYRFGIRQSIAGRLASVGAQARVEPVAGGGTRWILEWTDERHG